MENKTEELLSELAKKLGTTTEYLFGVLVNQAKYDILISVIQMGFMFAIVYGTYRLHCKFLKEPEDGYSLYSKYEEGLVIPMVLAGITSVIMIVCFLSGFNELVSAIFNPEYWALRQIMHLIK